MQLGRRWKPTKKKVVWIENKALSFRNISLIPKNALPKPLPSNDPDLPLLPNGFTRKMTGIYFSIWLMTKPKGGKALW